jgi:hypothetical protein
MAKEQIQWASPSPLWTHAAGLNDLGARRSIVRQPVILRFAADTFMDDLADLLAHDPARLPDLVANPETWRGPTAGPQPITPVPLFARTMSRMGLTAARAKDPALTPGGKGVSSLIPTNVQTQPKLKLYQPAHQRHYLVSCSLVCGRVGLPDHAINSGRHERASFVVRRMFPPGPLDLDTKLPPFNSSTWEEYAFIASAKGNAWRRIPKMNSQSGSQLIAGEEQLPMFPMSFTENDGRRRRLLAGLIPVGKRETYMGATFNRQPDDPAPADPHDLPAEPDPRMHFFWSQVTEPWKKLLEQSDSGSRLNFGSPVPTTVGDPPVFPPTPIPDAKLPGNLKSAREQMQTGSWYVLLDFAKLLEEQIPRVWDLLHGTQPASGGPINANEQALSDAIANTKFDLTQQGALLDGIPTEVKNQTTVIETLKDALITIRSSQQIEDDLEAVKKSYDRNAPDAQWPDFLFPLADPKLTPAIPFPPISSVLADRLEKITEFADLIEAALPATPPPEANIPLNPLISQRPMDMREGWFVIRCVFERPECGPIDPPLLSEPTRAFQMAGFFDPDAPARPIRIALPVDTSPAGLRKFDKNTAFMISDMLCGQIDRVKGMTLGDLVLSVLPWPFHQDLPKTDGGPCTSDGVEVGMICSLSIPIITICALLMLMIIVSLLDIIFRWMPFFIFCFPFPKFKSKS